MTEQPPTPPETDIAALAASVKAPQELHERVRRMVDAAPAGERARAQKRWGAPSLRLAGAMASAVAIALAAVLVVALTGGGGTPSVDQAIALTLEPATMAAPPENAVNRAHLDAAVEGVAFPYWGGRLGWHGSGQRLDRVDGRATTTVFYSNASHLRIGYAIVSGPAWATHGGTVSWRDGVPYRLLARDGANVIAWPRGGRLCILSGRGVSSAELLRIASWGGKRALAA
jgi:hypothetical protein